MRLLMTNALAAPGAAMAAMRRSTAAPGSGVLILVALLGSGLAAFMGLLLGVGAYAPLILLLVLLGTPVLVVMPRICLWVALVGALVLSGLIDLYLPMLKPLKWAFPIMAAGLAMYVGLRQLFSVSRRITPPLPERNRLQTAILLLLGFVLLTSVLNWDGVAAAVVGLKGYFQIWALLVPLYFLIRDEIDAARLMRFFVVLCFVQLPFVLHQYLFLIPLRSSEMDAARGLVAGDIVAGTFGGSMQGGGRSSSLAMLSALGMMWALAMLQARRIGSPTCAMLIVVFMLPMALSEAKLFMVLLPLGIFLLFRSHILRNPMKALVGGTLVGALLGGLFFAYTLIPGARSQQMSSMDQALSSNIQYNLGSRGYGNAVLNRNTVYSFWVAEHTRRGEYFNALFGHGPGASNGETLLVNNSIGFKRYRGYSIGLTGISAMLWDVGLIGTLLALWLLWRAYRLGTRLCLRWQCTSHWPWLKTAQLMMALFAVSLLHNNYFIFDISYQAFFIALLGYLLVMARLAPPQPVSA